MVLDCPQPRDKGRIQANRDVCGLARLPLSGLDWIGLDEMVALASKRAVPAPRRRATRRCAAIPAYAWMSVTMMTLSRPVQESLHICGRGCSAQTYVVHMRGEAKRADGIRHACGACSCGPRSTSSRRTWRRG
jgi:hypothetical protein